MLGVLAVGLDVTVLSVTPRKRAGLSHNYFGTEQSTVVGLRRSDQRN
jgi:hypothetical protein